MGQQCLLMGMIPIIKVRLSLDNDQTQRRAISRKNLENSKKSLSLWSLLVISNKTTLKAVVRTKEKPDKSSQMTTISGQTVLSALPN
jgi:hypothetical protein